VHDTGAVNKRGGIKTAYIERSILPGDMTPEIHSAVKKDIPKNYNASENNSVQFAKKNCDPSEHVRSTYEARTEHVRSTYGARWENTAKVSSLELRNSNLLMEPLK